MLWAYGELLLHTTGYSCLTLFSLSLFLSLSSLLLPLPLLHFSHLICISTLSTEPWENYILQSVSDLWRMQQLRSTTYITNGKYDREIGYLVKHMVTKRERGREAGREGGERENGRARKGKGERRSNLLLSDNRPK